MLKTLRIFNIILIDSAEISFEEGLNVITGETGSGKSAIMHSLSLLAGTRADATVIRKGCEKGVVEALFDIASLPTLQQLLLDSGIDLAQSDELIVRREIHENGKSRGFINNQMVQIAFLKRVGELLVDMVGQHASRYLLSLDSHRQLIDTYGNLKLQVKAFSDAWSEESALRRELALLENGEAQRLREIALYTRELEELQQAQLKEGEEEELFAEYTLLSASEELLERSSAALRALKGDKGGVLHLLNGQRENLEKLSHLDPSLKECFAAFQNATLELQEAAYTITAYQGRVESNPSRMTWLNERLKTINLLKRKYGSNVSEIQAYQSATEEKLKRLDNVDVDIATLKSRIDLLAAANDAAAEMLTAKRTETIARFEKAIVQELKALNMPKVEFEVELTAERRSACGNDGVEFFLLPNVGEHRVPLKDSASGGETSRVALAFYTLLAGKEKRAILIFDEIDANIGGATASVVGKKLKEIASQQQVICITHFPQVAKQASIHWQISKHEKEGRTSTHIALLDAKSRKQELTRMVGGTPLFT